MKSPGEATSLLTVIAAGILNAATTPSGSPEATLAGSNKTASGSISAGKQSVTFMPSSDFVGTIAGVSFPGASWQVVPFQAPFGKTLPAIAYTISAGSLNVIEISSAASFQSREAAALGAAA